MEPAADFTRTRFLDGVFWAALIWLGVAVAYAMYLMYHVRMQHDSAVFMYIGWLIADQGYVPYRDIFDVNMPVTYAFFALVVKLFGYTDPAMQTANLLLLIVLGGSMVVLLRRLGLHVALAAAFLFAIAYLGFRVAMFQREFVMLIPICWALTAATLPPRVPLFWRAVLAGFGFALAAGIKPQALIALPPLALCLYLDTAGVMAWKARLHRAALLLLGIVAGAAPIALAAVGYLAYHHALRGFFDITLNFTPLFGHLADGRRPIEGAVRRDYLIREYLQFGHFGLWYYAALTGAAIGVWHTGLAPRERRFVWLLLATTFAFSLYPVASGHFFDHHWLPFLFSIVLLAALALLPPPVPNLWGARIFAALVLAFCAIMQTQLHDGFKELRGRNLNEGTINRADIIHAALEKAGVAPGEKVQPLDWVWGGSLNAMLRMQLPIATRHLYYAYLQHHVSTPYIQDLRRSYVQELQSAAPRLIIEIVRERGWADGRDTARDIPEVSRFLRRNYRIIEQRPWLRLWERLPAAPAPVAQE